MFMYGELRKDGRRGSFQRTVPVLSWRDWTKPRKCCDDDHCTQRDSNYM